MVYELITNRNLSEGMGAIFVYVNDVSGGLFVPLFLSCLWVITVFIPFLYMSGRSSINGDKSFPKCLAFGGLFTFIVACLFRLVYGLVNNFVFAVFLGLMILGFAMFLIGDR